MPHVSETVTQEKDAAGNIYVVTTKKKLDGKASGLIDPVTGHFKKGHPRLGGMQAKKVQDIQTIKDILFNVPRGKWKALCTQIWQKAIDGDVKFIAMILAYKLGKPSEMIEVNQKLSYGTGLALDDSKTREEELKKLIESRALPATAPITLAIANG